MLFVEASPTSKPSSTQTSATSLFDELNNYVSVLRRERVEGGNEVDYKGYRQSQQYRDFLKLLRRLESVDLSALGKGNAAKAFWINFYNVGTIHNVVQHGPPQSAAERLRFFSRQAFDIGGFQLSLNDIEHGILRNNARLLYSIRRSFGPFDKRKDLTLELDPRIHFALNCGSRSCPSIRYYDAALLDTQLTEATIAFINQEVHADPTGQVLLASQIFKWYSGDFPDLHTLIAESSDHTEVVRLARQQAKIRHTEYDWTLNGNF